MNPNRKRAAVVGSVVSLAAATASGVGMPSAWAQTVTVGPGQTLSRLAAQLHTTVAALAAANHLADPNRVYAGQVLTVPGSTGTSSGTGPLAGAGAGTGAGGGSTAATGGTIVVVARGQTLSAIASRYHVSVGALAAANHLGNPNRLVAGSTLVIPSTKAALSTPSSTMQLLSYSVPAGGAAGSGGGGTGLPAALRAHPDRLGLRPTFVAAANRYGVPPALLEAVCWWESGWQSTIVSKTGAVGVCQIEPATAAFVNQYLVPAPLDSKMASQNIALGAAYLADLLRATSGDVGLALAGYYQGLTDVRVFGMLPDTAVYVRGIEAYATIFANAGS
jgi:LysM repeat protein